ncbi:hypothetical protein [Nonomuraea jabiensis]|uniref:hypothetical protein n=1 Tax=Nonomuraea jabiensis TaxID=882448 RepID=UPI003D74E28B
MSDFEGRQALSAATPVGSQQATLVLVPESGAVTGTCKPAWNAHVATTAVRRAQ